MKPSVSVVHNEPITSFCLPITIPGKSQWSVQVKPDKICFFQKLGVSKHYFLKTFKNMNHPSEWKRIYHPRSGKYVYKHKGTGVITDSLIKIGKAMKKPITNVLKQAGKKVAEKSINKASDVFVKKAGDKIGDILRKRSTKANPPVPKQPQTKNPTDSLVRLNNLIANL